MSYDVESESAHGCGSGMHGPNDFELIDDGTLDTVFRCVHCGAEIRTSPDGEDRILEGLAIAEDHLGECPALDAMADDGPYGRIE